MFLSSEPAFISVSHLTVVLRAHSWGKVPVETMFFFQNQQNVFPSFTVCNLLVAKTHKFPFICFLAFLSVSHRFSKNECPERICLSSSLELPGLIPHLLAKNQLI